MLVIAAATCFPTFIVQTFVKSFGYRRPGLALAGSAPTVTVGRAPAAAALASAALLDLVVGHDRYRPVVVEDLAFDHHLAFSLRLRTRQLGAGTRALASLTLLAPSSSRRRTPGLLPRSLTSHQYHRKKRQNCVTSSHCRTREHFLNLSIVTDSCDVDIVWHPHVPSNENPLHGLGQGFSLDGISLPASPTQALRSRTTNPTTSRCPRIDRLLWLYI